MKRPDYEQLTLFPVDSPASRSLLPGSDEARTTTVISGQRCYELSESCGLLGCLEKMLLASQIWHSTLCFLTWKTKATKQGRLWFQLAVSVPRTEDTGSPSSDAEMWTTPCAADARGTSGGGNCRSLRTDLKGQPNPDWVEWMMGYERRFTQLMPTVTASDSREAVIGRFAGGGALPWQPERTTGADTDGACWTHEPGVDRVVHGLSDRVDRIKCLGNAVVPQQFYPFFKYIYEIETSRRK